MLNMQVLEVCKAMDPLVKSLANCSTEDGAKYSILYGLESNALATVLARRSLFLENLPIMPKITKDICRVYSHTRNELNHKLNEGVFNECLAKLLGLQPMKSFMRLTFCQLVSYLTFQGTGENTFDMSYLMSFINELRLTFSTLCLEDRAILKSSLKSICNKTFIQDGKEDAPFLICWAIVEAAKYCVSHKFAPEMSATAFLDLLRKLTMLPVPFSDIIPRRSLIYLLQNLDKLIQDRTLDSATGFYTFTFSSSIESFYQANCSVFKSWFTKNRQNIARLSLTLNEPAECWRHMNFRLSFDLATRLDGLKTDIESSLTQTLFSINAKNWYANLSLLAISAKQLCDLPLLLGIQTLMNQGLIANFSPLCAIVSNLKGNYEVTYNHLQNLDELTELVAVEFLEACMELDKLEEHSDIISKLESKTLKDLYSNYLKSKSCSSDSTLCTSDIEKWLQTWPAFNDSDNETILPVKNYIDLIVPTCLNIVSKAPQNNKRNQLLEWVETMTSQDLIHQSIFFPALLNNNTKVYHVLSNILRGSSKLDHILIETHKNDQHWNHLLYRHLNDLDLIKTLRNEDGLMDLVQLRAAKYHQKRDNFQKTREILDDLKKTTVSECLRLESSLILIEQISSKEEYRDELFSIARQTKQADLPRNEKYDLIAKLSRRFMKSYSAFNATEATFLNLLSEGEIQTGEYKLFDDVTQKWNALLNSSCIEAKTKTYIHLSKRLNEQVTLTSDNNLLISAFNVDIHLLTLLNQSKLRKHQSVAIDCATRLLKRISSSSTQLSVENLDYFTSTDFIKTTKSSWVLVKANLISIVLYQNEENLESTWKKALISVLKIIVNEYPNLLIYNIIVNRLDLQNELLCLNDESLSSVQEPCTLILQSSKETTESSSKLVDCQSKLAFWNELLDVSKTNCQYQGNWPKILSETEYFLKEIRKISFLCGEYFKTLTLRIPKRLLNFLEYFSRHWDPNNEVIQSRHRVEECEKRLKNVCSQASNQIKVLLAYNKKTSNGGAHTTKYDMWFCETFHKHLLELEIKLNDLLRKRPLIQSELEAQIKVITDSLALCRQTLLEYNHNNRQKLFMELISPTLSRLEPSLIPMPDCCNDLTNPSKSLVTIYKISQTINLIVSKTSPKKLQFTGSDGVTRSFLLKAHEDLRLDQLIMDLFATINKLFLGSKSTQNKYKLRRYSVTPVSTRSALIQWIEAPSLCSFYRAWLNSSNGKRVVDELYETTCSSLCEEYHLLLPRGQHVKCQPAQTFQTTDIFYQLLWAKIKPSKLPLAQMRPTFGNIIKYHNQFDSSVFECVIEQLMNRMPKELISNQLWYKSNNSHSYWFKTREFIHSVATISMVGYIIGLGDRHPENILIDHVTGEVVHIDYNICFELGRTLSIPEQVPFRLTQNIIHAFGFAGLEGGFLTACCDVLDALKGHQITLLQLLEPINLSFMIGQSNKIDELKDPSRSVRSRVTNESKSKPFIPKTNQHELDLCSQESIESVTQKNDLNELLILNNSPKDVQVFNKIELIKPSKSQMPHSFDVQHNIETPNKILWKTAVSIHRRIANKLDGSDEFIHHYAINQQQFDKLDATGDQTRELQKNERMIDLITLHDAQITKNQVTALILEATSLKNKAAMFEGWIPWI